MLLLLLDFSHIRSAINAHIFRLLLLWLFNRREPCNYLMMPPLRYWWRFHVFHISFKSCSRKKALTCISLPTLQPFCFSLKGCIQFSKITTLRESSERRSSRSDSVDMKFERGMRYFWEEFLLFLIWEWLLLAIFSSLFSSCQYQPSGVKFFSVFDL